MKHGDVERRFLPLELRSSESGETVTICGYAAVFNISTDLGWFREKINPGAFDDVDTDTVALFNHDANMVLGRKSAGTLRLKTDERGLFMEVDLPNTSYAQDLAASISRGDIKHQSFAFTVLDDEWCMEDGKDTRIIKRVKHLFDVSPVTYPAYSDTTVAKRSLEDNRGRHIFDTEGEDVEIDLLLNHHLHGV